ncbi:MAG: helicase associated domain-containing protein, partial [Kiritimatiellae bacterium]|nr:helicase associated domain-containing protein [Kiritimatiellia bacterium]
MHSVRRLMQGAFGLGLGETGVVQQIAHGLSEKTEISWLLRRKALHCLPGCDNEALDVPHEERFEGYGLGDWLVKQRLRYAAGELTEREIADLEARGVRWSLRTRPR